MAKEQLISFRGDLDHHLDPGILKEILPLWDNLISQVTFQIFGKMADSFENRKGQSKAKDKMLPKARNISKSAVRQINTEAKSRSCSYYAQKLLKVDSLSKIDSN